MAKVELDRLTVQFGDVAAVDGISLVLNQGEFIVLLGPSGCGKTTALRSIAGLQHASSGEIRFDGKPVTGLSPAKRNVAMVFQFVSLYPHLTVRQNVAFPLRAKGVSSHEIGKKIEWIAKVFAIGDILDRYPVGLPPGSRQKAALARAVVRDPDVLLLDEPLSAVDEQYREEMRWELRHLQKELGITTVHVTHDQREAMSLADRVVLMRAGRIVQVGPPAALFNDPVDRFAAFFIGSPGMNFIDLTLAADGLHVAADETLRVSAPNSVLECARAAGLNQIVLGIRPHMVELASEEGRGVLPAKLLDAALVGRDLQAQFALAGQAINVVLPPEAELRDERRLRLPPAHCLFFAPDGTRLGER
jgi:ABC-type sugar transport system ATPase subunit